MTPFQVFRSYFVFIAIFLTCIGESIGFPKQLSSKTPLDSRHSIEFDSEIHPNENTTLCQRRI